MRATIKRYLSPAGRWGSASGATLLIYHRVGGGSLDERDVPTAVFAEQVERLVAAPVVSLDTALDRLEAGDDRPCTVLTFDDGFRDVYDNAWPLLRDAGLPFTLYAATAYLGGTMHWEGSTARDGAAPALSWEQLRIMVESGLCTVGNHTHDHVRPELLTEEQLDRCTEQLERYLGVTPQHFAFPWGIPVPRLERALRERFRSSCTGTLGRNRRGVDVQALRRVPVRGSDPLVFFEAKLSGGLAPERGYAAIVAGAKRLGARA